MSVLPTDFLESALAMSLSQDEMAVRNAISRAYYAAYHQAQVKFPSDREFMRGSRIGFHMAYIEQLMREPPGSAARFTAVKLSVMKARRAKADYELGVDLSKRDFTMQLVAANEVFDLLQSSEQKAEPKTAPAESEIEQEVEVLNPAPPPQSRPSLHRIR